MTAAVVVALVSAFAAVAAALISALSSARVARLSAQLQGERSQREQELQRKRTVARSKEPLMHAAYNLQSRFYNILKQDLIETVVERGDDRSRRYVLDNTVFLIGQYFAWTEIVRREIQFIDLGYDERTRELAHLRDSVHSDWQTDGFGAPFRVFAREQRAIGERMIREGPQGPECIGYAQFLDNKEFRDDALLDALRHEVLRLSTDLPAARPRLVALQHDLIDLLAFLDPQYVRFPEERRTKVR